MSRTLVFALLGAALCQGVVHSQTGTPASTAAYTLGFSTYLSHTDRFFPSFDVAADSKGDIYVSGNTTDRNFPTTPGAFQRELKGEADAFVAKFTPDGKLVFSTLIGGSRREHHTGLTVDPEGGVYLVGGTHSPDFPVTPGAYDTSFNGEGEWAGDVYVARLHPSGGSLVFATFIGGNAEDTAHSIKTDSRGHIIIGGVTRSPDFPATAGVIDPTFTQQDCFIAKFTPHGDTLVFSTSLGNGVQDMVSGLAIDDKDNIYATGPTNAADLPVTGNAVRKVLIKPGTGGGLDHFVAKISALGTRLLYLSYLGDGGDAPSSVAWAPPNRLLVSGSTRAAGVPFSRDGAATRMKGVVDGFVAIFDSDEMTLQSSTLFGGSQYDFVNSAYFLDDRHVVMGGMTNSADLPLSGDALDTVYPVSDTLFNSSFLGRRKAFVSVVDIKTGQAVYSTYFGACLRFRLFPDRSGNLAFIAETGPHGFPGRTDFPLSGDAFRVPPTNIMLGRLVPKDSPRQR